MDVTHPLKCGVIFLLSNQKYLLFHQWLRMQCNDHQGSKIKHRFVSVGEKQMSVVLPLLQTRK